MRGMFAAFCGLAISFATACADPASAPKPHLTVDSTVDVREVSCVPGDVDIRRCGVCQTGVQGRLCTDAGVFAEYSMCRGEDGNLPFDPRSGQPVCDMGPDPAVFLSPHPDDESIGMAGAILDARAHGRPVFIELLTHGEASKAREKLDDGLTDPWHPGVHEYALTTEEFGEARVRELLDAAVRLDVTGVVIDAFPNGGLTDQQVLGRIDLWLGRDLPGLTLAGTAGPQDPEGPDGKPHPDHVAVWNALVESGHADVRGYLIYDHTAGAGHPSATVSIAPYCATKASVLDAYGLWEPERGRYAVGFHSVRTLIQTAQKDCIELVAFP